MCDLYATRGFEVTDWHGDNKFDIKALKENLKGINFHIYGKDAHVDEIERSVRTVKERS